MAALITVAGGLLVALLVVGAVLYLTIGRDVEWSESANSDTGERVSEFSPDE